MHFLVAIPVSSFSGKGKRTVYKLLKNNKECREFMCSIGSGFTITDGLMSKCELTVCQMYNVKSDSVNAARYELFCLNAGQSMPPCREALKQHLARANYQAAIWKKADCLKIDAPSPTEHGWLLEENQLNINWYNGPTAPANTLQSVYCACKKSKCTDNRCSCYHSRLGCTDLCHCADCTNAEKPHMIEEEE